MIYKYFKILLSCNVLKGLARVHEQHLMEAIVHNLYRALRIIILFL
ncbi:MAG: hypothetical protein ACMUEL_00275 [Flavobacteriales bacterium Tduv]